MNDNYYDYKEPDYDEVRRKSLHINREQNKSSWFPVLLLILILFFIGYSLLRNKIFNINNVGNNNSIINNSNNSDGGYDLFSTTSNATSAPTYINPNRNGRDSSLLASNRDNYAASNTNIATSKYVSTSTNSNNNTVNVVKNVNNTPQATTTSVNINNKNKATKTTIMVDNSTTTDLNDEIVIIKTATTTADTKCTSGQRGQLIYEIENAINAERLKAGVPNLNSCKALMATANQKYQDILTQNIFTHTWAQGKKLQDVMRVNNYNPKDWGEILVYLSEYQTGKEFVDEWMASPSHRAILLNPKYKDFGVATGEWFDGSLNVYIGVAEFGVMK